MSSLPFLRPATRSDHEFLAPALEVVETPPSPVRMALILIICLFVATALAWSYIGHIDIIAAAQGKIQPAGRVKVVQPLLTGKVKVMPPQNGEHVHQGDILLELDSTEALADERDASKSLESLRAEIQRRETAVSLVRAGAGDATALSVAWDGELEQDLRQREEAILRGDMEQHFATIASLDAQRRQKEVERDRLRVTIAAQESLVETLKQRVTMRSSLVSKEAGTMASVIDATEAMKEQVTQLAVQQAQLADAEAAMDVLGKERHKVARVFLSEQLQRLGEAERRADELEQRLAKARSALAEMTLRSPIDGTIQSSSVTSIGQVVTVGQDLMRIVPADAALEVEVYMPNKDIGFIKTGQEAVVKLEAFPFTRYGTVPAKVVKVAADAIPEPDATRREGDPTAREGASMFAGADRIQNLVFPVTLRLEKDHIRADGADARLSPGMAAVAEVRTGERRILEYVFSPMLKVAHESMKER